MSLEEVGAYSLLLSYDWNEGGLPGDLVPFSRWLRSTPRKAQALWDAVKSNFELRADGRWYNPRLEKERAKQEEWRAKSAKGGRAGAASRWGDGDKGGHGVVIDSLSPPESPSDDTPFPTPSPVTTATAYPAEFELLWKAYPKRQGGSNKAGSYRCYQGNLKRGVSFEVMFEGVKAYTLRCIADASIGTRYVMDCKTFLGPDKHYLDDHAAGTLSPETKRLWDVVKFYGFASATRFTIEQDLERAKADGKITDQAAFKRTLLRLNRDALKNAKSDDDAYRIIADSLGDSPPEGLAA